MATLADSVSLRQVLPEDDAFLRAVYNSTREEELAIVNWNHEEKAAFLAMQFNAQQIFYRQNYPGAEFSVVEVGGASAGRLYVDRRESEIRVMDIALLPEFRHRGVGTYLLQSILDEAQRVRKSVSIHVEGSNPAVALYRRLGFKHRDENGIYLLMEWTPVESN